MKPMTRIAIPILLIQINWKIKLNKTKKYNNEDINMKYKIKQKRFMRHI